MWVYTHLDLKKIEFFVNLSENTNEGVKLSLQKVKKRLQLPHTKGEKAQLSHKRSDGIKRQMLS